MVSGQELLQKIQREFHNSGGTLSLTFDEFLDFFKLETAVAEELIRVLCSTGWFEIVGYVDPGTAEDSIRLQLDAKYQRNYWLYSVLVQHEAYALLDLGGQMDTPYNSGMIHLDIKDQHLVGLFIEKQELQTLPISFGSLAHLKSLKLTCCQLRSLPDSFGNLTQLTRLDLDHNDLTTLPKTIGGLTQLREFWCRYNQLSSLPDSLGTLPNLQNLSLDNNHLKMLPPTLGGLQTLQKLSITSNSLTILPESIRNLHHLRNLYLQKNRFLVFPYPVLILSNLRNLNLNANQLTQLPEEIHSLIHLSALRVKDNKLLSLPPTLTQLKHLQVLYVRGNPLTPENWGPLLELYRRGIKLRDWEAWISENEIKKVKIKDLIVSLLFQISLKSLSGDTLNSALQKVGGVLIIFDKSDRPSFNLLKEKFQTLPTSTPLNERPIALIGVCTPQPVVSTMEGETLAKEFSLLYFETATDDRTLSHHIMQILSNRPPQSGRRTSFRAAFDNTAVYLTIHCFFPGIDYESEWGKLSPLLLWILDEEPLLVKLTEYLLKFGGGSWEDLQKRLRFL
ncbi:hypothetical protein CEE45_04785 [Candidatus Heimdallarchaeota archaeon B3_Heim]|nr:MAG: hypothetical protein CEE45_04785 [Candidatus Heimdallarchaeota archaeon B3_Heim]